MFTQIITVPVSESTVRTICDEVQRAFAVGVKDPEMRLSDLQITQLKRTLDVALDNICQDSRVSVDGWNLSEPQVLEIAFHLRQSQKIKAIKSFRAFTDSGLKEAKNFIDRFCVFSDHKNACPLAAIKFQMAFGL